MVALFQKERNDIVKMCSTLNIYIHEKQTGQWHET